jgi:hypothetical protein
MISAYWKKIQFKWVGIVQFFCEAILFYLGAGFICLGVHGFLGRFQVKNKLLEGSFLS